MILASTPHLGAAGHYPRAALARVVTTAAAAAATAVSAGGRTPGLRAAAGVLRHRRPRARTMADLALAADPRSPPIPLPTAPASPLGASPRVARRRPGPSSSASTITLDAATTPSPPVATRSAFPTTVRARGSSVSLAAAAAAKGLAAPPALVFSHYGTGYAKRALTPAPADAGIAGVPGEWRARAAGEDAFFSRFDAIGVGDGVGGWSGQANANAGLYALKLMHYCALELDPTFASCSSTVETADPMGVLARAYTRTAHDAIAENFLGSSTALLCILTHGDELRVANLGDCGVCVIRDGEYVFRSEEQQHSFNHPMQLGTTGYDQPEDAQAFTIKVQHGDIVVAASDGVWDNVFEEEALAIVRAHVGWREEAAAASAAGGGGGGGIGGAVAGALEWVSKSVRAATGMDGQPDPIAPGAGTARAPTSPDVDPGARARAMGSASVIDSTVPQLPVYLPPGVLSAIDLADAYVAAADEPPVQRRARRAAVHAAARVSPQAIADAIAARAKEASEDSRAASPFQSRALREGLYFQGGKMDDLAVVVGVVRDPTRLMRGVGRASAAVAARTQQLKQQQA